MPLITDFIVPVVLILLSLTFNANARLEQGVYDIGLNFTGGYAVERQQFVHFQRSAYNGSTVQAKIVCHTMTPGKPASINILAVIRSTPCGNEFYDKLGSSVIPTSNDTVRFLGEYFKSSTFAEYRYKTFVYQKLKPFSYLCDGSVHPLLMDLEKSTNVTLPLISTIDGSSINENRSSKNAGQSSMTRLKTDHPLFIFPSDEIYLLIIRFSGAENVKYSVDINVEWKNGASYLGPMDWPLLPFYGIMCFVYVAYSVIWIIMCFSRWRDLLRLQYWIGAVIGLGLVEKMVFYIEYQKLNHTGTEVEGAVEFAEIVSCLKKTLSFILVIIVSIGFGVVKPRLGSTLQKVIGLGFIYFLLCSIEGVVRVSKVQHDSVKQKQIVELPLILLQLGLFYWIFTSLVNTTRALRLRRNEVKLAVYRHFTHTLIFCVASSMAYMLWSMVKHQTSTCIKDWKELWVDTAFWHVLFSILLLVIMILWRPTINNQRYAFSPLLDNVDDDDEDDVVFSEAFTKSEAVKLRSTLNAQNSTKNIENNRKNKDQDVNGFEDDLKWLEQHIPSSLADRALPALVDSEEEREQVKFEISKMQ